MTAAISESRSRVSDTHAKNRACSNFAFGFALEPHTSGCSQAQRERQTRSRLNARLAQKMNYRTAPRMKVGEALTLGTNFFAVAVRGQITKLKSMQ